VTRPARPAAPPRRTTAERREERAAVDDPAVVMAAAARLLEGRARSVQEVRRRLSQAGYRTELVEGVIERLGELEILDDEAFARAWVASRDRAHPRGERALRAELRLKGIAPEVITVVLAERAASIGRAGGAPGDGPDDEPAGGDGSGGDALGRDPEPAAGDPLAADRLLTRNERSLLRVADPRRRRQRAWATLARAGFDSETASAAVSRAERRWSAGNTDEDDAT
jgi:SOS response regulatory protein OraA/RecX